MTVDRGAPAPPVLELDQLSVTYPRFRLGPLGLTLAAGERVALVGPNGAGKSTALQAMAGRLPEYGGRVAWWGGELRSLLPGVRGHIGYLPEELPGFGWMTVHEHLRFLSEFYPGWDRAYEAELTERLGLSPERTLGTLSKGTKVKLSFVAAEAYRPPVLVLDEPTSGLDPVVRGELLDLLDRCAPSGGRRLLVFSSHILEDVARVCDRILLMKDGRIVEDTTKEELRAGMPGASLSRILGAKLAGRG